MRKNYEAADLLIDFAEGNHIFLGVTQVKENNPDFFNLNDVERIENSKNSITSYLEWQGFKNPDLRFDKIEEKEEGIRYVFLFINFSNKKVNFNAKW